MKMIVLFKMIAEGEHTPVNNFYAKVEAAAEEEGVVLREFKNEFMMPTTNMLREDQTEMVMERIEERWIKRRAPVPDATNMDLLEKHLNTCFRAKTPDMVAVGALYSAMRCVQEILKAEVG